MTLGILPKRNIWHLLSLELDHEKAKEMFTNYFEGCFGLNICSSKLQRQGLFKIVCIAPKLDPLDRATPAPGK